MLIYWLMFAYPSSLALIERAPEAQLESRRIRVAWLLAAIGLALLIGFRWNTGGDWGNYNRMVEQALWAPQPLAWLGDPGFTLLIGAAARSSWGMLVVTVVSGVLMTLGLIRFCLDQPRPWLCLATAVPYLVVVMGMGYIRQGMAVSLLMLGLVALGRRRIGWFTGCVLIAATFHSTALIFLPLAVLAYDRHLLVRMGLVAAVAAVLGYAAVSGRASTLVTNYVGSEMASSGALVRLVMTALPGGLFLVFRARFGLDEPARSVWTALSAAAIAALALLAVSPSSTVVDRVALYLLPLQCFVCARLPGALIGGGRGERIVIVAILLLYAAAFFTWLNYAVNIDSWLPYRSYFFEDGLCLAC